LKGISRKRSSSGSSARTPSASASAVAAITHEVAARAPSAARWPAGTAAASHAGGQPRVRGHRGHPQRELPREGAVLAGEGRGEQVGGRVERDADEGQRRTPRELRQPAAAQPREGQCQQPRGRLQERQLEPEERERGSPRLEGQQAHEPCQQDRLGCGAGFRERGRSGPVTVHEGLRAPAPSGWRLPRCDAAPPHGKVRSPCARTPRLAAVVGGCQRKGRDI
jgi:hypothetical protein